MRCGATPAISLSEKRIKPECAATMPVTALISEVLPAPFGPMMPWISPALTESDTSVTAATPPKRTESALISRSAIDGLLGGWLGRRFGQRFGGPQQFKSGNETDQSFRQEQECAEQNKAVDQFGIFLNAAQRLRQRGQRDSADDRTCDRTEPADNDEGDVLDRRQDTKLG